MSLEFRYKVEELRPKQSLHCLIIVVLNEGERLNRQLGELKPFHSLVDIIIADGKSSDQSTRPDRLKSHGVTTLLTTESPGLSRATRMAYEYALNAGYEGLITVDGNGKDGVEALPLFVQKLTEGYDLIQGSRFLGEHAHTPLDRLFGIRFIMAPLISWASGFAYSDPTNAFRACSRRFLLDARVQPLRALFVRFNLHNYLNYRAARLHFRVIEIPVRRVYPLGSEYPTKIRSLKLKWLCFWEMLATCLGFYNPRCEPSDHDL